MESEGFHPNSASIPQVLINCVLLRWMHPMIDYLPNQEDYSEGFQIVDSFAGTWHIKIEKVK